MPDPLLRIESLNKSFQARQGLRGVTSNHAVKNVNLDIHRGECLALVGESGSGKSTLARCLLRFIEADSGKVWHGETDLLALRDAEYRPWRRRFQMVFQNPTLALNPRQRIGACLHEPLRAGGMRARSERDLKIRDLLDAVGLAPSLLDRFPHQLSGGQRQRVVLARALTTDPEFIVADEPTSSLDALHKKRVLDLLRNLHEQFGLTLLIITHDLAVVSFIADRAAVMQSGVIVESGSAQDVLSRPRHPYTRLLLETAGASLAGTVPESAASAAQVVDGADLHEAKEEH